MQTALRILVDRLGADAVRASSDPDSPRVLVFQRQGRHFVVFRSDLNREEIRDAANWAISMLSDEHVSQ